MTFCQSSPLMTQWPFWRSNVNWRCTAPWALSPCSVNVMASWTGTRSSQSAGIVLLLVLLAAPRTRKRIA